MQRSLFSLIRDSVFSQNSKKGTLLFVRGYNHVRPVIKHNLVKPEVDLTKHDPHGTFDPKVLEFIKARDFENSGGQKVDVVSLLSGESKGIVELNDFVFRTNPRIDILHQNVVWYRASIRAGTACAKSRGDVRGGGRKPWPQKGTGRARQGSIRAPHWRKGGSAKGPKPRDWSFNLPYKIRRLGLRTALSCRLAQGDLTVVEDFNDLPPEPNDLQYMLGQRGLENALLVDGFQNQQLQAITKDIDKLDSTFSAFLHVYGILVRHKLVLSLQAVRLLEERLCEDGRIVTDSNYELYHQDMLLDKADLYKEYDPKWKRLRGALLPIPIKKKKRGKYDKKPRMSSVGFM